MFRTLYIQNTVQGLSLLQNLLYSTTLGKWHELDLQNILQDTALGLSFRTFCRIQHKDKASTRYSEHFAIHITPQDVDNIL